MCRVAGYPTSCCSRWRIWRTSSAPGPSRGYREGAFTYPNSSESKIKWISHEDVAAFALEALKLPEVADANLNVCGPERLSGEEITERFGQTLGRKISLRSMPLRQFGAHMYAAFRPGVGDGAVATYEVAYHNLGMFSTDIDLSVTLQRLPFCLTLLEERVRQHAVGFTALTDELPPEEP